MREVNSPEVTGYARIIQTILTTSGPMALIALALTGFLVWMVMNQLVKLEGAVVTNHTEITAAKVDMRAWVAKQTEIDKLQADQFNLLIGITQQICLNNAKTESAIRGCLGEKNK